MNYYVFRINYNEYFKDILKELILGNLRQGWGTFGMAINQPENMFIDAWKSEWDTQLSDETMKSRYNNLKIMTEIQKGDIIVIPKISLNSDEVCRQFVISRCTETYRFEVLKSMEDFGHIIQVENILSCRYDMDEASGEIAAKFRAYQSPLNRVGNSVFQNAVTKLIKKHETNPKSFEEEDRNEIYKVSSSVVDARTEYLSSIVSVLQNWDNKKFEYIIQELFEMNGYKKVVNNWYDGKGGDVDIIFKSFKDDSLMDHIFMLSENVEEPEIFVQAKKKVGIDLNDINAVNQLVSMLSKVDNHPILIVINLTEEFTKDAKEAAEQNGVILINGIQFASLLVRHGINVDIY